MPAPAVLGSSTFTHSSGTSVSLDLLPLGIPAGSWVVFSVITPSTMLLSFPFGTDYRTLLPVNIMQDYGTKSLSLFGYTWTATSRYFEITKSASTAIYVTVMWGSGAAPEANWQVGLVGVRDSANAVTNQSIAAGGPKASEAPSRGTSEADSLVLSLFYETSTSAEANPGLAGTPTETWWFHAPQQAGGERLSAATVVVPAPFTVVGPYTASYANRAVGQGAGVSLVLPPAPVVLSGYPIEVQTASGVVTGGLTIWDGSAEITPTSITFS